MKDIIGIDVGGTSIKWSVLADGVLRMTAGRAESAYPAGCGALARLLAVAP